MIRVERKRGIGFDVWDAGPCSGNEAAGQQHESMRRATHQPIERGVIPQSPHSGSQQQRE